MPFDRTTQANYQVCKKLPIFAEKGPALFLVIPTMYLVLPYSKIQNISVSLVILTNEEGVYCFDFCILRSSLVI